jgi:hypothetical protein
VSNQHDRQLPADTPGMARSGHGEGAGLLGWWLAAAAGSVRLWPPLPPLTAGCCPGCSYARLAEDWLGAVHEIMADDASWPYLPGMNAFDWFLVLAGLAVAGYALVPRQRPGPPDPVREHADRGIRELEGYLAQQARA